METMRAHCRRCRLVIAVDNRPLPQYNQLVLTVRTPQGALGTHEMLLCTDCRVLVQNSPFAVSIATRLYDRDVEMMVDAHERIRGELSPEMRQCATWLRRHTVIAVRNDIGASVAMLHARGLL